MVYHPHSSLTWKVPESNNSYDLNCMQFWVVWWNLLRCLFHPRCESSLCPTYPRCIHSPPVSHSVAALIIRLTVFQCLSSSNPLFYLLMARRARIVMLGTTICHGEAIKWFLEVKRWVPDKTFWDRNRIHTTLVKDTVFIVLFYYYLLLISHCAYFHHRDVL